jgi:hypothetical protein
VEEFCKQHQLMIDKVQAKMYVLRRQDKVGPVPRSNAASSSASKRPNKRKANKPLKGKAHRYDSDVDDRYGSPPPPPVAQEQEEEDEDGSDDPAPKRQKAEAQNPEPVPEPVPEPPKKVRCPSSPSRPPASLSLPIPFTFLSIQQITDMLEDSLSDYRKVRNSRRKQVTALKGQLAALVREHEKTTQELKIAKEQLASAEKDYVEAKVTARAALNGIAAVTAAATQTSTSTDAAPLPDPPAPLVTAAVTVASSSSSSSLASSLLAASLIAPSAAAAASAPSRHLSVPGLNALVAAAAAASSSST